MAVLKTYSISNDITGGTVKLDQLHTEIASTSHVASFDGLRADGDDLQVLGDTLDNETSLDTLVQDHTPA